MMHATHLVIGGVSAGCVIAARSSEAPADNVVLLEAGRDYAPDETPEDIRDSYSGSALMNPTYFWKGLKARCRADGAPVDYEQGRVLGSGSSFYGQVALRGAPEDYDHWSAMGAKGWDWSSILPYFRRLETDVDYTDQLQLPELLADPEALERHVRDNMQSAWHASYTCRMGNLADARTVVDARGKVVGAENLFIADASVKLKASRTTTERIPELVRQ